MGKVVVKNSKKKLMYFIGGPNINNPKIVLKSYNAKCSSKMMFTNLVLN